MRKLTEWLSFAKDNENCPRLKSNRPKILKTAAIISWVVMVVMQIVLLIRFNGPQLSDSAGFVRLAELDFKNGVFYPSKYDMAAPYISGNGIVNILILIFHFTKSLKPFFVLNILLVQLMLFSCIYIVKKLFANSTVHYWFTILFCLFSTMFMEVVNVRTEIPYTALCFFALAVFYSDFRFKSVLCGIILAIANWIRPLSIVAIVVCLFIVIYKKDKFRRFIGVVAGYACVLMLIGGISYASNGNVIYQSTTLGYNLIMSANDEADGSYMSEVFKEGKPGYIPPEQAKTMNYKDYDEYYKDISIEWIKKNPGKYIMQFPKKLFYLYSTETYSSSTLYNNHVRTSGMEYIKSIADKLMGRSSEKFSIADAIACFNQCWYMMIALLFVIGTVILLKIKKWRGILPLYLLMAGFTAIVVIIVGGARYHFPMLPEMIIPASVAAQYLTTRKKVKMPDDKTA
ncbi:MAG: hypothetical protein MJ168_04970 [Clostridia bacterium]|nr:hypothetical protein [Clostridia bacterium]